MPDHTPIVVGLTKIAICTDLVHFNVRPSLQPPCLSPHLQLHGKVSAHGRCLSLPTVGSIGNCMKRQPTQTLLLLAVLTTTFPAKHGFVVLTWRTVYKVPGTVLCALYTSLSPPTALYCSHYGSYFIDEKMRA